MIYVIPVQLLCFPINLPVISNSSSDLPFLHTRVPLQKLFDRGSVPKILEEGGYRHPRSSKYPSST